MPINFLSDLTAAAGTFSGDLTIDKTAPKIFMSDDTLTLGLASEVGGQLINYGTNYNQLGSRNGAYPGSFFRIDVRDAFASEMFNVKYIPPNSTEQTVFKVSRTGDVNATGNITLSGTVDGVDIAAFKTAYDSHTHTFASLTSKPTTLAGFGITDAYTQTQVNSQISAATAALVDSSPATLDTLNELAAALGDDPNFATTTATSIGLKAPLASPSFTGNVGIGTASPDEKLEVSGEIKISGGDYNGLYFENAAGTTKTLLYQHAAYDHL
jgi:hypothetical protein